jgi:hypothetical protein
MNVSIETALYQIPKLYLHDNILIHVQFHVELRAVDPYYQDLNKLYINLHYIDNYNPIHYHAKTAKLINSGSFIPKLTVSLHFSYIAKTFSSHPQ